MSRTSTSVVFTAQLDPVSEKNADDLRQRIPEGQLSPKIDAERMHISLLIADGGLKNENDRGAFVSGITELLKGSDLPILGSFKHINVFERRVSDAKKEFGVVFLDPNQPFSEALGKLHEKIYEIFNSYTLGIRDYCKPGNERLHFHATLTQGTNFKETQQIQSALSKILSGKRKASIRASIRKFYLGFNTVERNEENKVVDVRVEPLKTFLFMSRHVTPVDLSAIQREDSARSRKYYVPYRVFAQPGIRRSKSLCDLPSRKASFSPI